jgi:hypothetical protein
MFEIKGDTCEGYYIIEKGCDFENSKYLHHNGTIQPFAMNDSSCNRYEQGWYHTKEKAQKVLDEYLNPTRTPKHGDIVKYKYETGVTRVILLVDNEFVAIDKDGRINARGNWISKMAYPQHVYVFIKNIFEKGN